MPSQSEVMWIDLIFSTIIILVFLLPRFNRWPEKEFGKFSGKPKDYISSRRYLFYGILYLLTFAAFAFALNRLGAMAFFFETFLPDSDTKKSIIAASNFLGENALTISLVVVLLAMRLPQVALVDERWRGALLTLARVPKDVLDLKQNILESLSYSDCNHDRLERVMTRLQTNDDQGFWKELKLKETGTDSQGMLIALLIKSMYLLQINRQFDLNAADSQDLIETDEKLNYYAHILPSFTSGDNLELYYQHKKELKDRLNVLAEIMARSIVKTVPEKDQHYLAVKQCGINVAYSDQKPLDITKPANIIVGGLLVSCFLIIALSLMLFDLVGVSTSSPDMVRWFEVKRILNWTLGGWISYALAVGFGLFFHEVTIKDFGERSFPAQVLAFCFATLGSCIFFYLSREVFRPPHVWLAISFGLLALVVIYCRGVDLLSSQEAMNRAMSISFIYALASGILQLVIHLTFRNFNNIESVNVIGFFLFGFVRGGAIAFIVSYILIEYERKHVVGNSRVHPRLPFRRKIDGKLAGNHIQFLVKNISEGGALISVPGQKPPAFGDKVELKFNFATIRGVVVWSKHQMARVKFNQDDPSIYGLRDYVYERMQVNFQMGQLHS